MPKKAALKALPADPQAAELTLAAPPSWRPSDAAVRALARLLLSIAERERTPTQKHSVAT
jgi:hypothetical protein